MIYIFNILSDEHDDFFLQIKINPENTFFDFHNFIQSELNFDKSQMASFFLCNKIWEKQKELPLLDIETDKNIMQENKIADIVKNKNDKLLYVFDLFSERMLFISLLKIDEKQNINKPICIEKKGTTPKQIIISDTDIDLYGDNLIDDDINDEFNDMQIDNIDDYNI